MERGATGWSSHPVLEALGTMVSTHLGNMDHTTLHTGGLLPSNSSDTNLVVPEGLFKFPLSIQRWPVGPGQQQEEHRGE